MIKDLDSILLSVPSAVLGAVGAGMRYLEEIEKPVLKDIGWLGSRSAVVLGTLTAVPLLVWSFSKAVFAKTLNSVTLEKYEALKNFDSTCDARLNLVLHGLYLYPIFVMHLPEIIRTQDSIDLQHRLTEDVRLISLKVHESAQYWKL